MRPVAVSQPIFPAILPPSVPKGAVVSQQILAKVEASSLKSEVPQFAIGDTVDAIDDLGAASGVEYGSDAVEEE